MVFGEAGWFNFYVMYEETEFKLSLSPSVADRILSHKVLKPLRKGRPTKSHLISTYFDTPRHALRKSEIALRVRSNGNGRKQTIKAPFQGPAGLQNFREWTVDVNDNFPDLRAVDDPAIVRKLYRRRYEKRLGPVFTTDFKREAIRLRTAGAEFELAVDRGEILAETLGVSVSEPICEVEFELLSGDPARMFDIALELCEAYDLRLTHLTKAQRGYALVRPSLRPKPVKAPKILLSEEMSVAEAFNSIIGGSLEHMFANEIPTLEGKAEGVHQTRVAMRRLRAALRAFKKVLPYDKRKAFNGEFRWFQQRLAPARDWQVFLGETLQKIAASAPGDEQAVERLRRVARVERRRAVGDAVAYLESRRYARLLLQFERWIASVGRDKGSRVLRGSVNPFAKSVLGRTWRYFLEDRRPLSRLADEDLHEIRKRGKKARYATQFFSSLWDGPAVEPFMKLMGRFQDSMGKTNDAIVARHMLAAVKPGRIDPLLIRLAQDWSQARIRKCLRAAQPQWRRLGRIEPFWETGD
ncbi:MAG: CYTH and CHAD domain-containing protein [Candidatus Dadabacteria bacterium]|nr:CYTH and CHAD domain-containing protein [Candidatus Dadabacteria bacterium]